MIPLNRQAGTTQGHYLVENIQGNIAAQTPSKPSLFKMTISHSHCHLAQVSVTVKLTGYMRTECPQNLNMYCFILCLYTKMFGA